MPQGSPTIGFGRRGSLDRAGGSGQGGGGSRLTVARNLCINPAFRTGRDGYYFGYNAPLTYGYATQNAQLRPSQPAGAGVTDSALLGKNALLVGGLVYTRDLTFDFETGTTGATSTATCGFVGDSNTNPALTSSQAQSGTISLQGSAIAAGSIQFTQGQQGTPASPSAVANGALPNLLAMGGQPVFPGRSYQVTGYLKAGTVGRSGTVTMAMYDAGGNLLTGSPSAALSDVTTGWTQFTVSGTLPTGLVPLVAFPGSINTVATIVIFVTINGCAINEIHYLDTVRIVDTGAVANAVAGTSSTRGGSQDATDDFYATYFFHAQPNTTYTFSGYVRHAPELLKSTTPTQDLPNVHTTNNYALRLYDPNDSTDFPTSATTSGTTLTGLESTTWQRHAFTYTTGAVVTAPLELRLYGNKVWETDAALTATALLQQNGIYTYPWTWRPQFQYTSGLNFNTGLGSTVSFPTIDAYEIGSYWDCIQIEEGTAATAYIDGTMRGCSWIDASDDYRKISAGGNLYQANVLGNGSTDWTANSNTGDGVVVSNLDGSQVPYFTDWGCWFSDQDTGFSAANPATDFSGVGNGIYALTGQFGIQYNAPTNAARTRSALVFDYRHGFTVNGKIGGIYAGSATVVGWQGTLSFYARALTTLMPGTDRQIVFALEDAGGTNTILTQAITLNADGDWRRYVVYVAVPGNGVIDISSTRWVFRQANPANQIYFEIGGPLQDMQPYTATGPVDSLRDGRYVPGYPVNHECWGGLNSSWLTTIKSPGDDRNGQFEYYALLGTISGRTAASSLNTDDGSVGLPSFSGMIDNSTINLAYINRSTLFASNARNMREIQFAEDLYQGNDPLTVGNRGTQTITLLGDPLQAGSTGIGVHDLGTSGYQELYLRSGTLGTAVSFYRDGAHASRDSTDSGYRFAQFKDGGTLLTSTGNSTGGNPVLQLSDGATTPRIGSFAIASGATAFHPKTQAGDVVLRGENTGNTQAILLAAGPTSAGFLRQRSDGTQVGAFVATAGSGSGLYTPGPWSGGNGYIALSDSGNSTNSGYVAFYASGGNRVGYIGYATGSTVDGGAFTYQAGTHTFNGGIGATNGLTSSTTVYINHNGASGIMALDLFDTGSSTHKYLRNTNNVFEIINSANTVVLATVDDSGNLSCNAITSAGGITVSNNNVYLSSGRIDGASGGALRSRSRNNDIRFDWASSKVNVWVDITNEGAITFQSDRRLKTNVRPMAEMLDLIDRLDLHTYTVDDVLLHGVMADEAMNVFPHLVIGEPDGVFEDGSPHYQAVEYIMFVPILLKAVQELRAQLRAATAVIGG